MLEVEKSSQVVDFASVLRVRHSRKILTKCSVQKIFECYFLTLHPYYIYLHYPQKYERPIQRKTLDRFSTTHTPIFQRESHSSLVRNYSSIFSSRLHCHTLRGDLYPNTTHTFSKCRECFRALEVLGIYQKKPVRLDGCNRAYCGIWKVREDMTLRSPLVVGAWRVQVHWVDQAWRVFCYSCTPTLFSSESISTWRVAERFFAKFFDFFFDNTSRCYLVFASLFPTLKFYFILLIMDEYGLGQCYRLFALIYSYSALSLNQSKSNLAVILIWESKQAFMFSHKFELSYIYIYIYM